MGRVLPAPVRRHRRGASAIEFAFCGSALFGLILATLDWGWVFFRRAQLLAASDAGTRLAVVLAQDGDPTPAEAAATFIAADLSSRGIDTSSLSVTAAYDGTSPDEVLVVDVSLPFTPLVGICPTPDTLTAGVSMYLERQD